MKNKWGILLTSLCLLTTVALGQDCLKEKIVGKWCNPYTYKSSGELKGFYFRKDGKCEAINIPSLDLKTWEIKDGKLIIEGFDIQKDGSRLPYKTEERISLINQDSLSLVAQETPRIAFLYLNAKVIKEKVKREK